jgi:hypothetical protein
MFEQIFMAKNFIHTDARDYFTFTSAIHYTYFIIIMLNQSEI